MDAHIDYPPRVTYLGGPTVILEMEGLRLMTDPTLDPAGTTFTAGILIEKLSGPAVPGVGIIDLVLLTHDEHLDNLDHRGRELLNIVPKTLTTKAGAARLHGAAVGLSPWEATHINTPSGKTVTITATPARHGPAGIERIAGDVTGFLLEVDGDAGYQIYLTGETVFFEGISEVAKKFDPQYVFIFSGAAKPVGPFNVTMGANDAIDTAAAFPNATIIPIHFEGWSHYTENAATLNTAFSILGIHERLKILPPGALTDLPISRR